MRQKLDPNISIGGFFVNDPGYIEWASSYMKALGYGPNLNHPMFAPKKQWKRKRVQQIDNSTKEE